MKDILKLLFVGILSAVLGAFVFSKFYEAPIRVVEVATTPSPTYANFTDEAPIKNEAPIVSKSNFVASVPTDFTNASEKAAPAVVNIRALQGRSNGIDNFFGMDSDVGLSSGSGVILSSDGYIVTNNHVIEGATDLEITLHNRRVLKGKVIGSDPSTDLALVKVNGKNFPFLKTANSDLVKVGEWVLAVGNPFNLSSTVTAGIVSAKARNIDILEADYSIESFIQTDAAVNPGNSGGALVNTNGELVGVNTAIITRTGRYEGYSFAIPSNLVGKVVKDLKDYGEVRRGFLGITIRDLTEEMAEEQGLKSLNGVVLDKVGNNSAAEEGGLKVGDIISHVNGVTITTTPELQEQVALYRPGNQIKISYYRNGMKKVATVTLKDMTNSFPVARVETPPKKSVLLDFLGMEATSLSPKEIAKYGSKGVRVVSITRGGKIDRTNMELGFVITKVNDKEVHSVEDLIDRIREIDGKVVLEGVYEGYSGAYFYEFYK